MGHRTPLFYSRGTRERGWSRDYCWTTSPQLNPLLPLPNTLSPLSPRLTVCLESCGCCLYANQQLPVNPDHSDQAQSVSPRDLPTASQQHLRPQHYPPSLSLFRSYFFPNFTRFLIHSSSLSLLFFLSQVEVPLINSSSFNSLPFLVLSLPCPCPFH